MRFFISTKGKTDFLDITDNLKEIVEDSKIKNGVLCVFVKGSTAAITTLENEEGLKEDFKDFLEKIIPENFDYRHHKKWGDRNGAAHLRASLLGSSLCIPIEYGKLLLGEWQQVFLIDFDERPRKREIIVKILKE
jgi:secondary thiamine-phosphate synthase enzyme